MNYLYVLDPVSMDWTNLSNAVSGTPPAARSFHGLTSANGMLYVHGGVDVDGNVLSDLHAFDPIAVAWTDLTEGVHGIPPQARVSHGFASAGGKLYVHGGYNCISDLSERTIRGVGANRLQESHAMMMCRRLERIL